MNLYEQSSLIKLIGVFVFALFLSLPLGMLWSHYAETRYFGVSGWGFPLLVLIPAVILMLFMATRILGSFIVGLFLTALLSHAFLLGKPLSYYHAYNGVIGLIPVWIVFGGLIYSTLVTALLTECCSPLPSMIKTWALVFSLSSIIFAVTALEAYAVGAVIAVTATHFLLRSWKAMKLEICPAFELPKATVVASK